VDLKPKIINSPKNEASMLPFIEKQWNRLSPQAQVTVEILVFTVAIIGVFTLMIVL
jgi:hypothetical protein